MKLVLTLCFAATITPALMAGGEKAKAVPTTLTKIRKTPDAFKNVRVRFPIQFVSLGQVKNPFFTRFVPQRFANFYCWADEQQIWDRSQYEDIFGLMFMAKDNEQLSAIYKLKPYQRMMVTAVIRNTFQGDPWIEVLKFEGLEKAVNTASLSHLFRGHLCMQKKQWGRALAELSLAPGDHLPGHVMGRIHKDLARCYLGLGEPVMASHHLKQAAAKLQTVDSELRQMAQVAKARPETIPGPASEGPMKGHQRPMWEAFVDEAIPKRKPVATERPTPAPIGKR
jgi:hypothetical protein